MDVKGEIISYLTTIIPLVLIPWILFYVFLRYLRDKKDVSKKVIVREVWIDEIVEVNKSIVEFGDPYDKKYFEERYEWKDKLLIVAYIDNNAAGYIVWYDRFWDGSFYCWMAWVNPAFRRMWVLKNLMEYEDDWAKRKGYNKIKIKTRNNRRNMLWYLVKYDFQFTEVEAYPSIEDNRISLEKDLK